MAAPVHALRHGGRRDGHCEPRARTASRQREQSNPAVEQCQRVEIRLTTTHTPVHAITGSAMPCGGGRDQHADRSPPIHGGAQCNTGANGFEGTSQPTRMGQHEHGASGNHTGEGDHCGPGCQDRQVTGRRQVDSTVSRAPPESRTNETPDHGGTSHRPPPAWSRRRDRPRVRPGIGLGELSRWIRVSDSSHPVQGRL